MRRVVKLVELCNIAVNCIGKGCAAMRKDRSRDFHDDENKRADLGSISKDIVQLAIQNMPLVDFLRAVHDVLLKYSRCDCVEFYLKKEDRHYSSLLSGGEKPDFRSGPSGCTPKASGSTAGSEQEYNSVALIPMHIGNENIGQFCLKSRKKDFFSMGDVRHYKGLSITIGLALSNQYTQVALNERVKELTCLYGISRIFEDVSGSLDGILHKIVKLLPPAWQYPEVAAARITFEDDVYATAGFNEGLDGISANILIKDEIRGEVSVCYSEWKHAIDRGTFLREEHSLIDAVAKEVALIIERKLADENREVLEKQLRHADRLATIGQLAAGIAHELNEPLGNILGFAQLLKKNNQLSGLARGDVEKIEVASLHARETIRKLLVFARQTPPIKAPVNLNNIVKEVIYFIESRCAKSDIRIKLLLDDDLPEITGDASQLNQVMVNLVVNSTQAMHEGGKLTIRTVSGKNGITLVVEDTGVGMSKKTKKHLFMPFFTTKDVGEGTGLGLAMVHGIVTSHGGTINVDSSPGRGTKFEILFPMSIYKE